MKFVYNLKRRFKIALIAISIAIGSAISYSFSDDYFEISKNLEIFATLFQELNIYYVDETQPGELMKTGIDAMLKSLDPYTVYYPEERIEDFRFLSTGEYGGIGSLIRKHGEFVIISEPYEGFPAQKAGLMAGDIILEVDGQDVKGKKTSEMSTVLKGQAGSSLDIKILRPLSKDTITSTLIRENIKITDVPYKGMLDEKTGYIKLTGFTQTASSEVRKAFNELNSQGMEYLVLDLRGNGGGLLKEAVNIVNFFVPKGQEVVSTKGKMKNWDRTYRTTAEPIDTEIPVAVLINGSSASASEIVAGALQDLDRAVIIGQKSFGKGLVQQTLNLNYNTSLKVTVSKYYIPSGRCIQKIDYSHKENGKASEIPDSLAEEFSTKNGRSVFDAGGITPDIKVEVEKLSDVTRSLSQENLIFDFATLYRFGKDSLAPASEYVLTAGTFDEFKTYLHDKHYEYTTRSEDLLIRLKAAAEDDQYFDEISDAYDTLHEQIQNTKAGDVETFSGEIKRILENEIVSRYHYQTGRIESSLKNDKEIAEAKRMFNNMAVYRSVLDGTFAKKD